MNVLRDWRRADGEKCDHCESEAAVVVFVPSGEVATCGFHRSIMDNLVTEQREVDFFA